MEEDEFLIISPEEYYEKLQEMYIDESELNLSSDFEARSTLVKLQRLESDILKLRREITKDIRSLRNLYLNESIIEKPKILGIISIGKELSHTEKRKKLLSERARQLRPYEEIIEIIDDYILQVEDLRKYIKREALETYSSPKYTKVKKEDK
ncbi:MAG: hypothetical protein HZC47_10775 [Methanobacterium sp.]|uniref:hypothetical protein n=1 Tax=Methanobacterium sp. TaxID=2164 RepID=UPI003D660BDC|nr:hypothetical protein [Methanobacterium sp.]